MSTNPVTQYTSMALPGISGYDFSSIIKAMVDNYSLPLNQMNTAKSALETKKNAWRDINTRMSSLESTLSKLRDSATWNATKATSSKPDVLSVFSAAGAASGIYNIKIQQTATAQTVQSDIQTSATESLKLAPDTVTINVGSGANAKSTSVFIGADASLNDIAAAINGTGSGVSASVVKVKNGDKDGYRLTLTSTETGAENTASFSGSIFQSIGVLTPTITVKDDVDAQGNILEKGSDRILSDLSGSFQIGVDINNLATITINKDKSLNQIAAEINAQTGGAVQATVWAEGDGSYTMTLAPSAGGSALIAKDLDDGHVLGQLGFTNAIKEGNLVQSAQDAMITVNGVDSIVSSSNTFKDAIKGVTLTIMDTAADTTVTVKVSADQSQAEAAIQSFVDQYNSMVAFLNEKTKLEFESGSNTISAKGDLFGDPMVNAIRDRLRGMLSGDLGVGSDTAFTRLSQIGLTTSSENFGKSGTLVFDKTKFNEAMSKDAQSVINLLGGGSGGLASAGLANVMGSYVHDQATTGGRLSKTIASYDTRLGDLNTRITDFNRRIEIYTERTKLQFTRLETLLSKMEEQNQSFLLQLSQLSNARA